MPIQILPPDESAKKAKERVAEWKRQREIDAAKAKINTVIVKPEPDPNKSQKRKTIPEKPKQKIPSHEQCELNGWLRAASKSGNLDAVKEALEQGADINSGGMKGTALMQASEAGQKEAVEFLIANGAKIDIRPNAVGMTALVFACMGGQLEIVELLLSAGAQVNIPHSSYYPRETPLTAASRYGHREIVEILISVGAEINERPDYHRTALSSALENNHPEIAELLRKHGATE